MTVDKDKKKPIFSLLWNMVNELKRDNGNNSGTIISRYASIIDDRVENSGYSRSVDSLKLYTTGQLQGELEERYDEQA